MSRSKKRLEVEQDGICFLCKEPWDLPTIEHVYPRLRRERFIVDHFRNLVIACGPCNWAKGKREPTRAEVLRLRSLKRRYADEDYDLAAVKAEPQTEWLEF